MRSRPLAVVLLIASSWAAPSFAQVAAAPLSAFARAKATALLRDKLPCLGCHALGAEGGRIAPELGTAHTRLTASEVAAMIDDPTRARPGAAMPRTVLPPRQRDLIVRFLSEGARRATGAAKSPAPATAPVVPTPTTPDGAALYVRWCAACHGPQGRGDGFNRPHLPKPPTDHTRAAEMSARSDDALYDTIASGGAVMGRSPRMPAFGATLSPAEIGALVRHMRRLCQCEGPAWSRDGKRKP